MTVAVVVLSAPGRQEIRARCQASIEQSDIGLDATWSCQREATSERALEHWSHTFLRLGEPSWRGDNDLVLLLEDDCLVNEHILENIATWRWPHDKQFGAGWLYSPGGYCAGTDCWYTGRDPEWYGSVGVLMWRRDVPRLHELAMGRMAQKGNRAWDCALAWAVHAMGKKIRQHGPPLVEHQLGESLLDHPQSWTFSTTRGTFQPEWRRPPRHVHRVTEAMLSATRR